MRNRFEKTLFSAAGEAAEEFEQLLRQLGIGVDEGSDLEHGCLTLMSLAEAQKRVQADPSDDPFPNLREDMQEAVGVLHLVQSILHYSKHSEFSRLLPHLALLGKGAVAQTKKASPTDAASNKIFELRLALACLARGSDLELDDPEKSSDGTNPDVMCHLADGRRWGFACKVLHGDAPMTFFERMIEGIDQIERSKSQVGLVVVSLKNKLPHHELIPQLPDGQLGVFKDFTLAQKRLQIFFEERVRAMAAAVGEQSILDAFSGKKALPAVACPLEAVVGVKDPEGRPVLTIVSYLHVSAFKPEAVGELERHVLRDLNNGLAPKLP